tara:strand:- start:98 stop:457 length:360 start_codon:yes stop_codon:yes gene_type:complete
MSNDYVTIDDSYSITFNTKSTTSMESYPKHTYDFSNLIDDDSNTITINSSTLTTDPTYTVNLDSISTCTADLIDLPEVYSIDQIKEMCIEYPALSKAYDNFRTIYEMVLQDWKGKQDVE